MIQTDARRIEEALTRGVGAVYPSREFAAARLASGERLTFYLGIDPTGPSLHLGHAIALKKLAELRGLGHQAILLVGDFTATIGDPDKIDVRKPLSREEVLANALAYKEQAGALLAFDGDNPAELRYNSEWLSKLSFAEVLLLASKMTVGQMIERDMFQRRLKEGRPIYLHEFLYPLMQGYDSVAMAVDGEVGGTDQTFNMLAGRTLLKQMSGKEKIVLATKLLEDETGKKMGKTEGNMVALADSPQEMFGKVMRFDDSLILNGFTLCTFLSQEEIAEIKKSLDEGENPRDAKMRLASEIVALYHGGEAARAARNSFIEAFQKGGIPDDITEVHAVKGGDFADALVAAKIITSRGEWRRLIEQGGVHTAAGETITDVAYAPKSGDILKIGKYRFVRVAP